MLVRQITASGSTSVTQDRVRGDTTTLRPETMPTAALTTVHPSQSRTGTVVTLWATARPLARTNGQGQTRAASESSAAKAGRQRQTARAEDGTLTQQKIMALTGV